MKTCPCVLTGTLTSPDKINGASRESISTVNKAQLTATGNGLLLKFNSETPDLLQDGVYTPNQRHVTTGEVFLYWRSFVTCLWKVPETDATTSTTICYHSLKEFTVPDVLLALTRFAVDLQVCTNGCHLCYKLPQFVTLQKKIPKCPADYFHKDAKHTKSFLPFLQLAITVDLIKWPDTGQEDSCCAGS